MSRELTRKSFGHPQSKIRQQKVKNNKSEKIKELIQIQLIKYFTFKIKVLSLKMSEKSTSSNPYDMDGAGFDADQYLNRLLKV